MLDVSHQRLSCLHIGDIAAVDIHDTCWPPLVLKTECIITSGYSDGPGFQLHVKDGHPVCRVAVWVYTDGTCVFWVVVERIIRTGPVEWKEVVVHACYVRTRRQQLWSWQRTSWIRQTEDNHEGGERVTATAGTGARGTARGGGGGGGEGKGDGWGDGEGRTDGWGSTHARRRQRDKQKERAESGERGDRRE